ncbi:hypothetical protein HEK616_82700 (plasmid) [Streptomyces nigrescens]|uniref:Transposase n=1 Tax=Streptomyces nigrescens TaxID=1920 RepID=A0ABM8A7U2_STRNI|nr:hypothetical protein HEK616_82700 [Streptomyces nigrescens]
MSRYTDGCSASPDTWATVAHRSDGLHDAIRGVAATQGRVHAVRSLRPWLPVLSPAKAIECVSALLAGDAPAHLVAVVTKKLVEPLNPVRNHPPWCAPPGRLTAGSQPKPGRLNLRFIR